MKSTVSEYLAYARLSNGACPACGRILPHPKSDKKHVCKAGTQQAEEGR